MPAPRLSVPPPSKGKPVLIILLFLLLAVGAGVLTWVLYPDPPAPTPTPIPAPRPPLKLVELPVEDPVTTQDADVETDAYEAMADAEEVTKRIHGPRPPPLPEGTIDRRRLSAFIRAKSPQVRQCYERRLKHNPILQGVLVPEIRIHPSGRVMGVSFTQDTLRDRSVRDCVARTIRGWRFPSPEGGAVTIANPFRFAPRNE